MTATATPVESLMGRGGQQVGRWRGELGVIDSPGGLLGGEDDLHCLQRRAVANGSKGYTLLLPNTAHEAIERERLIGWDRLPRGGIQQGSYARWREG